MKFRTKYENITEVKKRFRPFTNPGSSVMPVYASKYDQDGHLVVYKSGERDLQEYIESYADSCDLNKLVKRFTAGDTSALDQVRGAYIDTTNMPKTMAELYNMVNDASRMFDGLPVEIKDAFHNNPVEFYQDYGSDSFNSKVNAILGIEEPGSLDPVNEVILDESK